VTRFASLTLAYHQRDYLELSLRAVAPHVETMYVMYSDLPFTEYNPGARDEAFRDDGTRDILSRLERELPHLRVLSGTWPGEGEMRNDGLHAAAAEGHDRLLVIDADEFFHDGVLGEATKLIAADAETDCWSMHMRVPFRFADYVIDRDDERLPLALRIRDGVCFQRRRIPNVSRVDLPSFVTCFNLGFVLSDERMYEKTRTWSHSNQIPHRWFEEKWLGWTPETTDLHTRMPPLWPRTRRIDPADLPAPLAGHPLLRRMPCAW
jgi:hypothetical protein